MLSRIPTLLAARIPAPRTFVAHARLLSTLPGYTSPPSAPPSPRTPLVSLLMEIGDSPGALHDILRYFWKYDLNITRIESRPSKANALNQVSEPF